jgi:hypothetical protein
MFVHRWERGDPKWGDPKYEEFMRQNYHEIRKAHLEYRIPTLAETIHALSHSDALKDMMAHLNQTLAKPRVPESVHFGHPFGNPTGEGALFAVAVLRRAGYGVSLHIDDEMDDFNIELELLGFRKRRFPPSTDSDCWITFAAKHNFKLEVSLPGTSPDQLARRGILWCIPRFKRWAKRAIENMYTPGGNGALHAAQRFAARAS